MSDLDAIQSHVKAVGETRNVAVDYTGKLDNGELLTGSPTVSASPSGLTIANVAVNTSVLIINGASVIVGRAVQFTVSGGAAGAIYRITTKCNSTSTPAQVSLEGRLVLQVY